MSGHICVDLDGTLAKQKKGYSPTEIGEPIKPMVQRVKDWLDGGVDVKIFTARVSEGSAPDKKAVVEAIKDWCAKHIGKRLEVTNIKTKDTIEIWDDRAVGVVHNEGQIADLRNERQWSGDGEADE